MEKGRDPQGVAMSRMVTLLCLPGCPRDFLRSWSIASLETKGQRKQEDRAGTSTLLPPLSRLPNLYMGRERPDDRDSHLDQLMLHKREQTRPGTVSLVSYLSLRRLAAVALACVPTDMPMRVCGYF